MIAGLLADATTQMAAALAMLAVAGAALAAQGPLRESRSRRRRIRQALGAPVATSAGRKSGADPERARRRQIEATIRELAARQKAQSRRAGGAILAVRLKQAGLRWSRGEYLAFSGASGLVGAAMAAGLLSLPTPVAAALGFAAGLAAPHLYVGRLRDKRLKAILGELPDALDVIVRGVRSGLPLGECLRLISVEGREPLRSEIRQFVEDMAVGLTVDEAGDRLHQRAPILEIRLLAIILTIQNRAGGNLSEAIGNLSRVLRDRRKMQGKIRAMSTEATASAAIIAALPAVVCLVLYVVSPDYVSLLFTTSMGKILVAGCGVWMLIGVLMMRGMIRFEV